MAKTSHRVPEHPPEDVQGARGAGVGEVRGGAQGQNQVGGLFGLGGGGGQVVPRAEVLARAYPAEHPLPVRGDRGSAEVPRPHPDHERERAGSEIQGFGPFGVENVPDHRHVEPEPLPPVPKARVERAAPERVGVALDGREVFEILLLDQTVLTVSAGGSALSQSPDAGTHGGPAEEAHLTTVKVPLRCLFALSGMGFLGASSERPDETVRVSATASWLRLDARYGAVVRRRLTALPLLV